MKTPLPLVALLLILGSISAGSLGEAAAEDAKALAEAAKIVEPDGYFQGEYHSPVPPTLKGAAVIDTEAAEKLHAAHEAVFIDVYPRPPKPPNLPAGTIWRDRSHMSLPDSHWLPNVGFGLLPPDDESYFTRSLEALTGGDKSRPIVLYCQRDCWMSWNAGKRAMALGYSRVIWFPDGTDGWQEAGNDLVDVKPLP